MDIPYEWRVYIVYIWQNQRRTLIKRVKKSSQVWWSKTGNFDHRKFSDSEGESLILGIDESMSHSHWFFGDTHGRPEDDPTFMGDKLARSLVNSPASACIYGILLWWHDQGRFPSFDMWDLIPGLLWPQKCHMVLSKKRHRCPFSELTPIFQDLFISPTGKLSHNITHGTVKPGELDNFPNVIFTSMASGDFPLDTHIVDGFFSVIVLKNIEHRLQNLWFPIYRGMMVFSI